MARHRVFVIWTHPLFQEAVHRLLNHPDIDWVGATSDHAFARDQIYDLSPDTILIEEEAGGHVPAEALEILNDSQSDVRVIRLSLADNELQVYHRTQRTITQAEDLLHLIQSD